LSLLYRNPHTGGELHQAGAGEIPKILRRNNISLLILAAREYQPAYITNTGGNFPLINKIYLPLKDTTNFAPGEFRKTVKDAKKAAKSVVKAIKRGENVLSTCKAGWNRSGIISGLALVELTGASGKEVIHHIRKNRSRFALSNPLFARVVANS